MTRRTLLTLLGAVAALPVAAIRRILRRDRFAEMINHAAQENASLLARLDDEDAEFARTYRPRLAELLRKAEHEDSCPGGDGCFCTNKGADG